MSETKRETKRESSSDSAARLARFVLDARKSMTFDTETSLASILLLSGFACEISRALLSLGETQGSNEPEAVALRSEIRKITDALFDASSRCKGIVDELNAAAAAELNESEPVSESPKPPTETIH